MLWVTDHAKSDPSTPGEKLLGRGKNCPLETGIPCQCTRFNVKSVCSVHFEYFILNMLVAIVIAGYTLILDLAKAHYTKVIYAAAFKVKIWLTFLAAKCSISNIFWGVFVSFSLPNIILRKIVDNRKWKST